MPDVASKPPKLTVSGWLYQPFASAGLEGKLWAVGAVSSYLRSRDANAAFPAWSRQVPLTTAMPLSGPAYLIAAGQDASPESRSLAEKLTESGALYQPSAFGARETDVLACGAVASYLNANDGAALFPARSRQLPLTDAVAVSGPM